MQVSVPTSPAVPAPVTEATADGESADAATTEGAADDVVTEGAADDVVTEPVEVVMPVVLPVDEIPSSKVVDETQSSKADITPAGPPYGPGIVRQVPQRLQLGLLARIGRGCLLCSVGCLAA